MKRTDNITSEKENKMKKISIIIPVYNTEKYVIKCLESIKKQTMKDFEVIIVNDGSKDNSKEVIHNFMENNKDLSIVYIEQNNFGLSVARNNGVKHAKGEYICFLDSDDFLDENLFESLKQYIDDKIDLIKYKFLKVDKNGKEIQRSLGPVFDKKNGQQAFERLYVQDNYLEVACIYLYRREFWNKHNFYYPAGKNHEDFALTPLIIVEAKSVVSTNIYGYYYVERKESITTSKDYNKIKKNVNDLIYHYDFMNERIKNKDIEKKLKKQIYSYYSNAILSRLKDIKKEDRKEYIKKIKERKIIDNIMIKNIYSLFKYIILKINVNIYLALIG